MNDGRSGHEGKPFQLFDAVLDASDNRWTARFNDGESIEDIKKRVAEFIEDLKAQKYDSVLIVTSQWIIYVMLVILDNLTNEQAWNLEVSQGSWIEREI